MREPRAGRRTICGRCLVWCPCDVQLCVSVSVHLVDLNSGGMWLKFSVVAGCAWWRQRASTGRVGARLLVPDDSPP